MAVSGDLVRNSGNGNDVEGNKMDLYCNSFIDILTE